MAYSIYQDMEEVNQNPDKWVNHGRQVLEISCHHKDGVENAGYCSACDISEDSAFPMMNYLYPLECSNFEDKDILKVVKETNMTILENTESGEFFLALCGGGMDLSQDIALAYQILETWIPQNLLREVCAQPCLSLGSKNYKKLARGIIKQLKMEADKNKQRRNEWKESLKNLREKEKKEREEKQK